MIGEPVIGVRCCIGTGEMGIETGQLHGFQFRDRGHESGPLLPIGPEPSHASVELELQGHRAALAAGEVLAEQGFAHAADGGHELPVQTAAQLLYLGEVAEHQDWRFDAGPAQLDAFAQVATPH